MRPRSTLLWLPLLALPAGPGPARGQSPFYPGPDIYACPGRPVAIVSGDFNADHVPDIVAAGNSAGSIVLLEGQSGGVLLPPRPFVVGGQPSDLAVADLDRDDSPDIVWVDGRDGGLAWMLGSPEGPQLFSSVQSRPGEDEAVSLAVLDLEPDGWPDVVTANQGADLLTIYRNAGGSLEFDRTVAVGDAPGVVRAVRWPGAATPSLLVAQTGALSDDVGVYTGSDRRLTQTLSVPAAADLRVEDWNGDAWPDLLALEAQAGAVSIWTGDAAGSLALAFRFPVPAGAGAVVRLRGGASARRLALADAAHNRVALYRGPANGPMEALDAYFVGRDLRGLLTIDLDQDGIEELVVALGDENAIAVVRRTAAGLRAYPAVLTGSIPASLDLLSPVGGDPFRLAVLCAESNDVRINRLEHARWRETDVVPAPPGADRVAWVRLDNDSFADLMIVQHEVAVQLIPGTAGGFAAPIQVPLSPAIRSAAAGDIDGDGDLDLVLGDVQVTALRLLVGDGSGAFVEGESLPLQDIPEICAARDLDLDGRADLLALDAVRSCYIAFSDPGGLSAPLRFDVGEEPRALAFGNLNGDGLPDVVCANSGESTFTAIVSSAPRFYALGARHVRSPVGAGALCLVDADASGFDDVVVSGPSANEVALHLNGGDNSFSVPISFRCTSLALGLAGGDFDGDGRGDVVVLDGLGNALVTLLSIPSPPLPAASYALAARRTAAGVALTARASGPVRARRVRDGASIQMQPVDVAAPSRLGDGAASEWSGFDFNPASGPESYLLETDGGQVVAQALADPRPQGGLATATLQLLPPSPNPGAGPWTFRLRSAQEAPQVWVHDVRGRKVARLQPRPEADGWYSASWDGTDVRGLAVGAGRYFVQVRAAGRSATATITRRNP